MKPSSSGDSADNWLWQVTDFAPGGEWINIAEPKATIATRAPAAPPSEFADGGWMMSSFDLASGTVVMEDQIDTVPAPLLEHLFFEPTTRD